MKAEDLMIGDIVTFDDCQNDDNPVIVKIYQINQDGNALVYINDDTMLDEIAIDDEIVGLPITLEILEKNGFTKGGMFGKTYYRAVEDFEISVYFAHVNTQLIIEKRNGREIINMLNAEYLHILQHALKLCGIEKDIML